MSLCCCVMLFYLFFWTILTPFVSFFCHLWSSLLFSLAFIPTFSTAYRKKMVLSPPSFSLSCVFILQVEVGDFLKMWCCPPATPSCSSSLSTVYLCSPSLSDVKAPWGGLGGEWSKEGLTGVTIITWLPCNSLPMLPVLSKADCVCVCVFIPISWSTVWYYKGDRLVALTASGETDIRQARREQGLSGCCVCRGQRRRRSGAAGEVLLNIFLSLCFAGFIVILQTPAV